MARDITKKLAILGACSLASATSSFAAGGVSHGGGADLIHPMPAWFVNTDANAVVHACYVVSPSFGISNPTLEKIVNDDYQQWADYLALKHVESSSSDFYFAKKIQLASSCTGKEDLKFYFGVQDDVVKKAKTNYQEPYGFAELSECSQDPNCQDSSWKQGFVWIAGPGDIDNFLEGAPAWGQNPEALRGLLLHELGHVFGNGHVEGTTMTPRIADYLEQDTYPDPHAQYMGTPSYCKIDSQIELVACPDCAFTVTAAPHFDVVSYPDGLTDWQYSFNLLAGQMPTGNLSIGFHRLPGTRGDGTLVFTDDQGEHSFDVVSINALETTPDPTPLFDIGQDPPIRHQAADYIAQIKTATGQTLMVSLAYNENLERVSIKPIGGSSFYPRPIFVSAEP
jgi:hypothetical protein